MKLTQNSVGIRILSIKKSKAKCSFCGSNDIMFYNEFLKKVICNKNECFQEISNLTPLSERESENIKIDKIIIIK
jgi:hypothetical protein